MDQYLQPTVSLFLLRSWFDNQVTSTATARPSKPKLQKYVLRMRSQTARDSAPHGSQTFLTGFLGWPAKCSRN